MKIKIVETINDYTDTISQEMVAENAEHKSMYFNVYHYVNARKTQLLVGI